MMCISSFILNYGNNEIKMYVEKKTRITRLRMIFIAENYTLKFGNILYLLQHFSHFIFETIVTFYKTILI